MLKGAAVSIKAQLSRVRVEGDRWTVIILVVGLRRMHRNGTVVMSCTLVLVAFSRGCAGGPCLKSSRGCCVLSLPLQVLTSYNNIIDHNSMRTGS